MKNGVLQQELGAGTFICLTNIRQIRNVVCVACASWKTSVASLLEATQTASIIARLTGSGGNFLPSLQSPPHVNRRQRQSDTSIRHVNRLGGQLERVVGRLCFRPIQKRSAGHLCTAVDVAELV